MNYFEMFGLPAAPSVNRTFLAQKYFELQKENHPDFHTHASDNEKENAQEQSASINKAFQTFQSSEKTLEYFLTLKGFIVEGEKYSLSPEFLMEMMEINEYITDEEQDKAKSMLLEIENELIHKVQPLLDTYDSQHTSEDALEMLKEYYYKKKYVQRILDRLAD